MVSSMANKSFSTLNLSTNMIDNLNKFGYKYMTPIQEKGLQLALDKKDIIAKAKKGSGKTATFSIPIINNLNVKNFNIQTLIIAPTRELAQQIADELKNIAKAIHNIKILTLCGGVPYKPQVHSLSHKAHIIVGTAGRILKHLQENSFETNNINTLVLDEADRMLDMGFLDDILQIIDFLPTNRQTMLFSATYPLDIDNLAKQITKNPISIEVDTKHNTTNIKQTFYQISQDSFKKDSVISILQHHKPSSTIIFCNTKIECDNLADELEEFGLEPLVIHSDLDQKDRTETIILFANRSYPILIATDVASRGLDIDDVDMVINYDMPNNSEVFTHRIGRTARAGKDGLAISLVSPSDQIALEELEDYLDTKIDLQELKIDIDYDFRQTIEYQTLYISGGKKLKLSAGDILGVLLNNTSLTKTDIGKINILPRASYVAIKNDKIKEAKTILSNNKIKGKFFRIYDR